MGCGVHRYVELAISDAGTAAKVDVRDSETVTKRSGITCTYWANGTGLTKYVIVV